MAKPKEQKYKEAVIRNIKSNIYNRVQICKYENGPTFPYINPALRMELGIKPHDTQFDEMIKNGIDHFTKKWELLTQTMMYKEKVYDHILKINGGKVQS
jgi:hypothetical protein